MKDIENRNYTGQRHGYQEWYWNPSKLGYKCLYNNGIEVDYEEFYYIRGGELEKSFYI